MTRPCMLHFLLMRAEQHRVPLIPDMSGMQIPQFVSHATVLHTNWWRVVGHERRQGN